MKRRNLLLWLHRVKADSSTALPNDNGGDVFLLRGVEWCSLLQRPSIEKAIRRDLVPLGDWEGGVFGTIVEAHRKVGAVMQWDSGEETRIRTVAASSMLQRDHSVRLRLTERGFELISEGATEPVICESWPRAKRVLQRLGVSDRKMNDISAQLSEGSEIIVRTRA